jgi:hypothetical protein
MSDKVVDIFLILGICGSVVGWILAAYFSYKRHQQKLLKVMGQACLRLPKPARNVVKVRPKGDNDASI